MHSIGRKVVVMTTAEFKRVINGGDDFIDIPTSDCIVINAVKTGTNHFYMGIVAKGFATPITREAYEALASVASGEKVTCCLNVGNEYYLKIIGSATIEVVHPVGGVITSDMVSID